MKLKQTPNIIIIVNVVIKIAAVTLKQLATLSWTKGKFWLPLSQSCVSNFANIIIIQNEVLSILTLRILRDIGDSIRSTPYYSLIADEVIDSSSWEQVVICLRWVDKNLKQQEDFIGLYKVDSTAADVIVKVLKDTLLRFNLSINRCCGQYYDGESSMSGRHSGTAVQNLSHLKNHVHCQGCRHNYQSGGGGGGGGIPSKGLHNSHHSSFVIGYS